MSRNRKVQAMSHQETHHIEDREQDFRKSFPRIGQRKELADILAIGEAILFENVMPMRVPLKKIVPGLQLRCNAAGKLSIYLMGVKHKC